MSMINNCIIKIVCKKNLIKLGIDVKPEVCDQFRKACEANGTLPLRLLKEFIKDYIKNN